MILVDVNLLVYVIDEDSPFHAQAIAWWEPQLQSGDVIGLGWNSLFGFLRVITNGRAVPKPLSLEVACQRVDEWLALPQIRVLQPTAAHFESFKRLLRGGAASPKLISDAHFAALAVEHDCELCSADSDFGKFTGLHWRNPLTATASPTS
jgi:hypothetical protein